MKLTIFRNQIYGSLRWKMNILVKNSSYEMNRNSIKNILRFYFVRSDESKVILSENK